MKYIQTLKDLLNESFNIPVRKIGIYGNIDPVTKLLLDMADIGVSFNRPYLASVFPVVITSYECVLNCDFVINGGNDKNNPLYSYNVGRFIESNKMKPAFVYHYNFPLINDLLPIYDIRCVFYDPSFMKDPGAVKDLKYFESWGLTLVQTDYINEDDVIYLPGIEDMKPYPIRKVSYKFGRPPFGMEIFDPFSIWENMCEIFNADFANVI